VSKQYERKRGQHGSHANQHGQAQMQQVGPRGIGAASGLIATSAAGDLLGAPAAGMPSAAVMVVLHDEAMHGQQAEADDRDQHQAC
jgi:hypothetical protein